MLIVQKYGGATLSDPSRIQSVADSIAKQSEQGNQLVVVVSAMGKTTNQLIDLAHQVSSKPHRRELDMLLTSGERISMSLLSMALHDRGCKAISFTGSQAGIFTDDSHVNANIIDVKAERVQQALHQKQVVVLAGFQGVSPKTKEITTLGRGGSDTTAVAMAAFLKADRCEILKDVPSIFTADPNSVTEARPIEKLSYQQLLEMTYWGAKVVNYRSVELALRGHVPLFIGPAHEKNGRGTMIQEKNVYQTNAVLAINSLPEVICIRSTEKEPAKAFAELQKFLLKNELPSVQLLELTQLGEMLITAPSEVIADLKSHLAKSSDMQMAKEEFSAVSVTCTSATSPEIVEAVLAKIPQGGQVKSLKIGPMTLTVFVKKESLEKTLTALHTLVQA